jgi:hypothetical protein
LGESARDYGLEFASALDSLAKTQADEAATAGTGRSINPDGPKNVNPTQNSKANSDRRFFAGAHLGMSIKQCADYYKHFGNVGALMHSGAPPGQEEVDFRNDTVPQRRVYITFRKSDGEVLSVIYWKLGTKDAFSTQELQTLVTLNGVNGRLMAKFVAENEFMVTTPTQYRLQRSEFQ